MRRQLLKATRRPAHISRRDNSTSSLNTRPLRFESLEDRRMLAVFSVDNLNDTGAGSLRAAIDAANLSTGTPDEITFSVNGTINIASQLPAITDPLTITGPSANLLTINAGNGADHLPATFDGFRIFNIDDGNPNGKFTVAISGLTLTGGDIPGDGGAIFNRENLTLTSSTVSGNSGHRGGGTYSYFGPTTIIGSTISGNTAIDGGGIYSKFSTLTITGSTLSGNSATNGSGGGIASNQSSLTIIGTTISGNSSAGFGGSRGGGIWIYSNAISTVTSSIITGNSAGQGSEIFDYGYFGARGYLNAFNLIGDSSKTTAQALVGVTIGAANILATSNGTSPTTLAAILAPLANNGGPTKTHALVPGSPAIDAINPLVTPTGVSSNLADFFPASQLIDNSGLGALTYDNFAAAEHANAVSNNSWVTQDSGADYFVAGTPPELTFTLPGRMLLTDIVVWGYAFSPGTFQNNEAKTLEVSFSINGGASFGAPITLQHARTGVNSETLSFGGIYVANAVRVRITDNHFGNPGTGGGDRVGLGEVRFLATPPATDQRGAGFPRVVNDQADIGAFEVQALSADFDFDGDVDGRDFLAWQRGFGTPAPTAVKSQGDADNDLDVDGPDLVVWQLQYGTVPPLMAIESLTASVENQDPENDNLKERAGLSPAPITTASTVSTASIGLGTSRLAAFVENTYVEEVDRALEALPSLRRYGKHESGEMVARRGVVRRFEAGSLDSAW